MSSRLSVWFLILALLLASAVLLAQNAPFDVGIRVGQKIPSFRLSDQNGKQQDFNSIKGPKGVALLFFRSADW